MSYIDGKIINGKVWVSEKKNGVRNVYSAHPNYVYYYVDPEGTYTSIFGDKLKKFSTLKKREFEKALEAAKDRGLQIFESDINPLYRFLEEKYPENDGPPLNVSILDIETDKDPTRGYSRVNNPYSAITAITIYNKWEEKCYTILLTPPNMTTEDANELLVGKKGQDKEGNFIETYHDEFGEMTEDAGYFVVDNEADLLRIFFEIIEDADVLSGWNCIPITQSLWLENRITTIQKCSDDDILFETGLVRRSPISKKERVDIKLNNGQCISASLGHKFRVRHSDPERYSKLYITKKSDDYLFEEDISVGEMISLKTQGKCLFVEVPLRKNTNAPNLRYTELQCYLAGLIYTDGTLQQRGKRYGYTIYQSDFPFMESLVELNSKISGPHKGCYQRIVREEVLGEARELIYVGDNKRLDLELLSTLSESQFLQFLAGLLDGDGCASKGMLTFCNFNNDLNTVQELLLWNGMFSIKHDNVIQINDINEKVIPYRKVSRFGDLVLKPLERKCSSKARLTRFKKIGNSYFVKIDSINNTGELVDMMDIETDTHLFVSAGIRTHNCEFYDIPYLIMRTRIVLGGEDLETIVKEDGSKENPQSPSAESMPWLLKFGLFPSIPTMKMTEHFGSYEKTFQLNGRICLDYMALYKKFRMIERHSYKLADILKVEIQQGKVEYEGSLDKLYRNDFRRFCAYNRQDVMGLHFLDEQMRFIDLANAMAHKSSVDMYKVTGSVVKIEQAVLKQLHKNKRICFDNIMKNKDGKAPGAYVIEPETAGLYEWVMSVDLTSMYPNIVRAINISPEALIGQFELTRTNIKYREALIIELGGVMPEDATEAALKGALVEAWKYFIGVDEYHSIINEEEGEETLIFENGDKITTTGKEWKAILREQNWSISANGTVFDLNVVGIIPECLGIWFDERAATKKKSQQFAKKAEKETDPVKKLEYEKLAKYYDILQQSLKIYLNSLYGAFLNNYFRFYDSRYGRSVTLTGRCITHYMANTADTLMEEFVHEH